MTVPQGPFRPGFFRSPLRGPWLTATSGVCRRVAVRVVSAGGPHVAAIWCSAVTGVRAAVGVYALGVALVVLGTIS